MKQKGQARERFDQRRDWRSENKRSETSDHSNEDDKEHQKDPGLSGFFLFRFKRNVWNKKNPKIYGQKENKSS